MRAEARQQPHQHQHVGAGAVPKALTGTSTAATAAGTSTATTAASTRATTPPRPHRACCPARHAAAAVRPACSDRAGDSHLRVLWARAHRLDSAPTRRPTGGMRNHWLWVEGET